MKSRFYLYRKAFAGFLALPLLLCLFYSQAMATEDSGPFETPCSQRHGTKNAEPKTSVQHCSPVLASVDQLKLIQISFQTEAYTLSFVTPPVLSQQTSRYDTQRLHLSLQDSYIHNHVFRL